MNDLISRQAAIDGKISIQRSNGVEVYYDEAVPVYYLKHLPSAQPTLHGYNIEHLTIIAHMLQKENLPPERVADALMDIGRIVDIIRDEFNESLRRAVEQCMIR